MDARFQVLYRQYKFPRKAVEDNSLSCFNPMLDAYMNFVRRVHQYIDYVLENPCPVELKAQRSS